MAYSAHIPPDCFLHELKRLLSCMQLVDNDSFLQRLASLFEASNQKGSSVWLTHKRLTYEDAGGAMDTSEAETDGKEYPCLIRVTNGKDINLSTHVMPNDMNKFHAAYGALLKNSMPKLRKRDKKKEKERADRIALRKKRILDPVVVEGPKRGNGRRKRQRRIAAVRKQEASRQKFVEREQSKSRS